MCACVIVTDDAFAVMMMMMMMMMMMTRGPRDKRTKGPEDQGCRGPGRAMEERCLDAGGIFFLDPLDTCLMP